MATLRLPEEVPPAKQDAEKLRDAVQGLKTDEIIWILGHRNASQRRQIRETYQQLYNESLIDRLYFELSGDFRKAVIMWITDPSERDAKLAKEALSAKKKGIKQLQVIVEIACAASPNHLQEVRQAYCSLFDCSLEEDIVSAVSLPLRKNLLMRRKRSENNAGMMRRKRIDNNTGMMRRKRSDNNTGIVHILVAVVSSYRYDKELVDTNVANSEAAKLHDAIKSKKLDNDDIIYILSTRNFSQLRATFGCYYQNFGNSIDQDIESCGKGDLESLLRLVIKCIDAPDKHFAKVIETAITGLGTDEDSLTRAIVTRAEIDTEQIRGEYFNNYKTNPYYGAVIGDTSGDYKHFLLTLLGAKV